MSRIRALQGRHRGPTFGPSPAPFPAGDRPGADRRAVQPAVQVVGQLPGRGIPPRRVFLQALQTDRLQVARQPGLQLARRDGLGILDLLEGFEHGGRSERRPARQQFIEDRSQGVDVGRGPDVPVVSLGLFGGHVAGASP